MLDYKYEIDAAESYMAWEAPGVLAHLAPAIGEGSPAVWRTADGFIPGYISEESAVLFRKAKQENLACAVWEARLASAACCV